MLHKVIQNNNVKSNISYNNLKGHGYDAGLMPNKTRTHNKVHAKVTCSTNKAENRYSVGLVSQLRNLNRYLYKSKPSGYFNTN